MAYLGQVQEFVGSLGVLPEVTLLSLLWKLADQWPYSSESSRITAVLCMILKPR